MAKDTENHIFKLSYLPPFIKNRIRLHAEKVATTSIVSMPDNAITVEQFWVIFNFEYRQGIERALAEYADIQT